MVGHQTLRPPADAIALIVAFCAIAFAGLIQAQTSTKPFSKDDVVQLLKGSVPSKRVEELAQKRGVDFQITPDVETQLRQAGATNELLATLRALTSKESSHQPASLSSPRPLAIGTTVKVSLDTHEETFYKTPLSAGNFKILLDIRPTTKISGGLYGNLSILDSDGATLKQNAINIGAKFSEDREVHHFSNKKPMAIILKVVNGADDATYWLTLLKESDPPTLLFGEVAPQSVSLGDSKSGLLDTGESSYYVVNLVPGKYKLFFDMAPAPRIIGGLYGDVWLCDSDGANQQVVADIKAAFESHRAVTRFSIRKTDPDHTADKSYIIRVHNAADPTSYSVKIVADTEE